MRTAVLEATENLLALDAEIAAMLRRIVATPFEREDHAAVRRMLHALRTWRDEIARGLVALEQHGAKEDVDDARATFELAGHVFDEARLAFRGHMTETIH